MIRGFLALACAFLGGSAWAQGTITTTPLFDDGQVIVTDEDPQPSATVAPNGGILRALDKVSGELVDFDLAPNQTKQMGRIIVTLGACRYPTNNPNGDAYAYVSVHNLGEDVPVFSGWMIASSPALNGLDHARYDVWPLRCKIAEGD